MEDGGCGMEDMGMEFSFCILITVGMHVAGSEVDSILGSLISPIVEEEDEIMVGMMFSEATGPSKLQGMDIVGGCWPMTVD